MDATEKDRWMDVLRSLGKERGDALRRLRRVELDAGAVAGDLMEHGVSKAKIAREMGVSAPHVGKLAARSEAAGAEPGQYAVPWLGVEEAAERLAGRQVRVIAGSSAFDVLYASKLDPRVFRSGWSLEVAHALVVGEDGDPVCVDNVNVGYLGTGPGNMRDFLLALGAAPDVAERARTHAFLDAEIPSGEGIDDNPHGFFDVGLPIWEGDVLVARLGREDLPWATRADVPPGRGPGERGVSPTRFEAYVRALDGVTSGDGVELPPWLEGERVARVFFEVEAAREQGFADPGLRGGTVYSIVVQQGLLQMWLPIYQSLDPGEVLSEEAYRALEIADLRVENYDDTRNVRRTLRQLGRLVVRRRPWIDVSRSGEGTLSYVPLAPRADDEAPRGTR